MIPFFSLLALGSVCLLLIKLKKNRSREKAECQVCGKNTAAVYLDETPFCARHAKLMQEGIWISFSKGNSTPEDPEFGVRLYHLKKNFDVYGIASYIKTDYAEVGGEIISKMDLIVLEEDLEKAKALSKSLGA